MGRLTTHVLDIESGIPARGMRIELHRGSEPIAHGITGDDGRLERPILEGAGLERGQYELAFHVAAYFRTRGALLANPPFLDVVVIRFGVADPTAHYHVPLLVSQWSYSTYRGS